MDEATFRTLMGQPTTLPQTPQAGTPAPVAPTQYIPPAQPVPAYTPPQTAPIGVQQAVATPPTIVGTPAGFTRLSVGGGGGNTIDIKKQPGRAFQGRYLGKTDFKTKKGMDQVKWNFAAPDGTPFSVYGFTNLNRALEQVAVGKEVIMTYTGMVAAQTAFGMRNVHQCTVDVAN